MIVPLPPIESDRSREQDREARRLDERRDGERRIDRARAWMTALERQAPAPTPKRALTTPPQPSPTSAKELAEPKADARPQADEAPPRGAKRSGGPVGTPPSRDAAQPTVRDARAAVAESPATREPITPPAQTSAAQTSAAGERPSPAMLAGMTTPRDTFDAMSAVGRDGARLPTLPRQRRAASGSDGPAPTASSENATPGAAAAQAAPAADGPSPQVQAPAAPPMIPQDVAGQLLEYAAVARSDDGFEFRLGTLPGVLGRVRVKIRSYGDRRIGLVLGGGRDITDRDLQALTEALKAQRLEVVDVVDER